ncbi:MAG: flagellar biosynthesis repressor FlbT [Hyphomonadaceae bacterium]|nr:flagellar biosynthesis repressor FlbT [Hyphomonadaceae bacterium]
MPLKLSLKPNESFVVNGAVVRNGDRRGVLLLETQARVLREKDILQPEDANTPAKSTYFAVMQMYLLGQTDGPALRRVEAALAAQLEVLPAGVQRDRVLTISAAIVAGDLYGALSACRKLVQDEAGDR